MRLFPGGALHIRLFRNWPMSESFRSVRAYLLFFIGTVIAGDLSSDFLVRILGAGVMCADIGVYLQFVGRRRAYNQLSYKV